MAREEAEKLRVNIQQEESKNAKKIVELNQKIKEFQSQNRSKEIAALQEELKSAQDYAQELKNTLKITVQTLEKEIQTDLTGEDIDQTNLKNEELRQQLVKQKRLSVKTTTPVNPSLGDSNWANLVAEMQKSPTESASLSPSQIKEMQRQKKQQDQSAQIQINLPPKK